MPGIQEKLSGILEQAGYVLTDSEEADFDIYNTCTVRDNADQRVYGRLGHLNSLKKKNPHMKVALCGCMMQEPAAVVEKLRRSLTDLWIWYSAPITFTGFAELIWQPYSRAAGHGRRGLGGDGSQIVEELPVDRKYSFQVR